MSEQSYLHLLNRVLTEGTDVIDRTGVGTRSIHGATLEFDLLNGFPIYTTKKVNFKAVVSELLWFLEGSTDERRLAELRFGKPRHMLSDKRTIWTDNADKQGVELGYENNHHTKELGNIYGKQWRDFNCEGVDQIKTIIDQLKHDRSSRRIILAAWNPAQLYSMALPPCHMFCQFLVKNNLELSCISYLRSNDLFLGNPFNVASYALLTQILASETNLIPSKLVCNIGDAHIYHTHFEAVKQQLTNKPLTPPKLKISDRFSLTYNYGNIKRMFELNEADNFTLCDYVSHGIIAAPMAV